MVTLPGLPDIHGALTMNPIVFGYHLIFHLAALTGGLSKQITKVKV